MLFRCIPFLLALVGFPVFAQSSAENSAVVAKYCATCHSDKAKTGGLSLQSADLHDVSKSPETWEKVIRKLRVGAMPPQGAARPDAATVDRLATYLETSLDTTAAAHPNPGRATMHRLNRTEYGNAIHDLLGLEVDAASMLPPDDESSGFDNIADVLRVSPSLMERYLSASWNISRLALANPGVTASTAVYRVAPDLSQDQHIEGLPLGSRGGILVRHTFPADADYVVKVRMWRNTFDLMRGMEDAHEVEIAVDGARVQSATFGGREDFGKMAENPGEFGKQVDQKLTIRLHLTAGPHTVSAASVLRSHALRDDLVKPFLRTTVDGEDIVGDPSVDRLSIEGPFQAKATSSTPSRNKILICKPTKSSEELGCAREILTKLTRQAYRRPAKPADLEQLLSFYQRKRNNNGTFDQGIESALQLILSSPEFLFRFESDPDNLPAEAVYKVDGLALASRLSFFLWSSVPDEPLLTVALSGKLSQPAVLEQQIRRMLTDPRADALIDNFAEQWLFLRNLKSSTPNLDAFPDFDDNLRQAMRQETKMFFASVLREDRSILDLLNADYTFVNERLAKHYGIPNIYGSQFRRIPVSDPNRRGLLGQASILTVTSYPNRTSPVQRGKWILTNLLGVPPQPPPPNVPELKDNAGTGKPLSLRERMEAHRANAVCAGCHKVMDPIGFSLENFDAIGRWRASDEGAIIDPSGVLFNGASVQGPAALREMISSRPQVFAGVFTEKLLTYAIGRSLESYDMPAVRKIVRESAAHGYRFIPLVTAIVESVPFEMRMKKAPDTSLASAKER